MVTSPCAHLPLRSSPSQPDSTCLPAAVLDEPGSAPTSLLPLQAVRAAFAALSTAREEQSPLSSAQRRRLHKEARAAGPSVVPLLLRGLLVESPAALPALAAELLTAVGGQRVIDRLSALLGQTEVADVVKERAIEILASLRAPTPSQLVLKDPDALIARGVRDLIDGLRGPDGVGPVLDQLFELVPGSELAHFVAEVETHGGPDALPLLRALIHDPRTPRELALSLTQRVRPTALPGEHVRRDGLAEQLERALFLISSGDLERACTRLTGLQKRYGDDAEVLSALGLCRLRLGQPKEALGPLRRAAEVEPQVAAHHWNVAVAAEAAELPELLGAALAAYLSLWDRSPGAEERKALAEKLQRSVGSRPPVAAPASPVAFPYALRPPRFPTPRSGPPRSGPPRKLPSPSSSPRRRWRPASTLATPPALSLSGASFRNGHC